MRALHRIGASIIRVLSVTEQGSAVLEPVPNTGDDSDLDPPGTDAPVVSSAVDTSPTSAGLGLAA